MREHPTHFEDTWALSRLPWFDVKDGELVGDPTEGALVVLAAKGGLSAVETRAAYPRLATLPFDSAYKLMATFHAMRDEAGREVVRAFVKGAPDQLLARGTHAPLDRPGGAAFRAAVWRAETGRAFLKRRGNLRTTEILHLKGECV